MSHKIKNPEKKFIKAIAPKFIPESGECLHIETQERYSFKTTGGHWYSVYRQGKEVLKALSIRQPWAQAIVDGHKDIENRDWNTKYRGKIYIHASKTFDKDGLEWIQEEHALYVDKNKNDFYTGGLIGTCEIVDVKTESESPWFCGKYGFVITNQMKINPIEYKGQLGFFEIKRSI